MKNIVAVIFILIAYHSSQAQQMNYAIMSAQTKSISKGDLLKAESMVDIREGFPLSWIKDFVSSSIERQNEKQSEIALGINQFFSEDQKNMLQKVHIGDDLIFKVVYKPNRKGESQKNRTIEFIYKLVPENQAFYQGGVEALDAYVQEEILSKFGQDLPSLSASFIIDTKGNISDIKMEQSSGKLSDDALLMKALSKMATWNAAKNYKGETVAQEFRIVLGNEIGC